jgi:hypothetical protein
VKDPQARTEVKTVVGHFFGQASHEAREKMEVRVEKLLQAWMYCSLPLPIAEAENEGKTKLAFFPIAALISHSCDPCTKWSASDKKSTVTACENGVEKGKVISLSYVGDDILKIDNPFLRQLNILHQRGFACACELCTAPPQWNGKGPEFREKGLKFMEDIGKKLEKGETSVDPVNADSKGAFQWRGVDRFTKARIDLLFLEFARLWIESAQLSSSFSEHKEEMAELLEWRVRPGTPWGARPGRPGQQSPLLHSMSVDSNIRPISVGSAGDSSSGDSSSGYSSEGENGEATSISWSSSENLSESPHSSEFGSAPKLDTKPSFFRSMSTPTK